MDKTHRTLLGFDFGMRRIGVAVGQTITQSAQPLATLNAKDGIPEWDQIEKLIATWHADGIVVGLPLNMDGTKQQITHAAIKFARRLEAKFKLPVYQVDERLTTIEAKSIFNEKINPEIKIDSFAAKLILESWLRESNLLK